jgi:hypothetical protein
LRTNRPRRAKRPIVKTVRSMRDLQYMSVMPYGRDHERFQATPGPTIRLATCFFRDYARYR